MRITGHSLVLLLALTGCQFTPSPTSKTVTTNDVVGVWSFTEDSGKTTVSMTFMPSGVFTQKVVTIAGTNSQVGKWTIDGPHLDLNDFLAEIDGGWKPYSMHWYFIDGDKSLELYGGAFPDSDAFQHLTYLGAAP